MQSAAGPRVAEFVRALALAWKNLAAYPTGHPVLAASLDLAQRRATELRGPAGEVVLGVATDGIVYGDEKIESLYAQKFGHALFTRGVAIVRFENATDVHDIETFLRLVGVGARAGERPIWEELTAAGVMNIFLQPVDYSAVRVTDSLDEAPPERTDPLWDEILRALLAGRELTPETRARLLEHVQSIDDLSSLILRYVAEEELPEKSFDPDATFGVRLTRSSDKRAAKVAKRLAEAIGGHIASSAGERRRASVQQVMQLLRSLPEPLRGSILRAVLRTLATDDSAAELLREVASAVPDDTVLEALRYLSTMQNLSTHALYLMQTLAAAHPLGPQTEWAPPTLLTDLVHLFAEDDIDRFNPPDHRTLLTEVTVDVPSANVRSTATDAELNERLATLEQKSANQAVCETLLEMIAGRPAEAVVVADRVEVLFGAFMTAAQYDDALAFVRSLQEIARSSATAEARTAMDTVLSRIADEQHARSIVETLVTAPPESAGAIRDLIDALGVTATRSLVVALAEENNRSRRRKLFDLVASFGARIVPEVRELLSDPRWFVVRNMIVLLRTVDDRTSLPDIQQLARHPDLRVRLEAIKSLLTLDPAVPRKLLEDAVNDPDPKLAEKAIALVANYGIREGVGPLLSILKGHDVFGSRKPVRLKAIKALGELAEPSALKGLERFFTDSVLPWPARDERRAVWESLAGYPRDAVQPLIQKGLRSRDPVVREICRRLTPEP